MKSNCKQELQGTKKTEEQEQPSMGNNEEQEQPGIGNEKTEALQEKALQEQKQPSLMVRGQECRILEPV